MKASVWLHPQSVQPLLKDLVGRQVIAVTNLDDNDSDNHFDVDTAAILVVSSGVTTVEPAKRVGNRYRLA
jgi:hypothetical protein